MDRRAAARTRWSTAALARLELVCDTYLSVSTPVQLAAAELLDRGAAVRAPDSGARRGELPSAEGAGGVGARRASVLTRDGGWYAVMQVPSLRSEEDLVLGLLTIDGVLAHPGYFFDFPRESFLVVSLLPPEAPFADGIDAHAPALRLRATASHDVIGPAAAGRACSSRCSRVRRRASWGIGDIGDSSRSPRGWLRRPARAAAAAAQRDGARPAVAVFGDQRDGDRSDLHPRAGGARIRGARRRGRRSAPDDRDALGRGSPRRRASTTQRSDA